jgi:flagellar protein FlgJ
VTPKSVSHGSSEVYGDFATLEKLKGSAHNSTSAMRQVAKQFESVFARMMIKSMRDAIGKDPIFGSDTAQTYQGMFDDQLSMQMTQGRGLGLADMLMRQLQRSSGAAAATPAAAQPATSAPAPPRTAPSTPAAPVAAPVVAPGALAPTRPIVSNAEQKNFIQQVWPQAQSAAQQLGVTPVSLVAQAALETNWGRNVPRGATGASSNNLFGIKAGSGWDGASVVARTTEFQNGSADSVAGVFRAYDNPGQSFQDYVALLRSNPRYSGALNSGNNVHAFASALQQGGYATDPDYARKVTAVAHQVTSTLLANVMSLKFAGGTPLPDVKDA